ncbi:MAG: hypothetical protein KF771_08970 [Burkholderiales bacterium]|nr:hypothetical protein [Burkholderiales bacterium]
MIVSLNFYYAHPGKEAAVLRQRIRACDVRSALGLPRGQVCAKIEGGDDWPDTLWRLDFPDMAGQHTDMAARAASPDFEAIRLGMRKLYRRFERPLYAGGEDSGNPLRRGDVYAWSGIFCAESACPAVSEILADAGLSALDYQSGGKDVPRFIVCGDPAPVAAGLSALGARLERSLWRVEDPG